MAHKVEAALSPQADPAQLLAERIQARLSAYAPELVSADALVRESAPEHGCDYQTNAALAYAKRLGLPPRRLAEELASSLEVEAICHPPEVAGPGFVNFRLKEGWLAALAAARLGDPYLGSSRSEGTGLCVVDYSSPNVAKEMHVGHL